MLAERYLDQLQDTRQNYEGVRVLVTGGASFISSHLVETLVALGAIVRVVDDMSSGKIENLSAVSNDVEIITGDLRIPEIANSASRNIEVVFHMAADHGGRGYIDTHPVQCLGNMSLDHQVFLSAAQSQVKTVVHASSACAYPTILQDSATERTLLREDQGGFNHPGQAFADGAYGWAKLMGEYQLEKVAQQFGVAGVSCRIFTAYGERENESHAAVALMAKAFHRLDPFPVWGDGTQTRNFTYVADTVMGLILAGAKLAVPGQFDVVNVGVETHYTINDLMESIFNASGWRPLTIDYQIDKPVGVKSRAADCAKSIEKLGWKPSITLDEGVTSTYSWYTEQKRDASTLNDLLMQR